MRPSVRLWAAASFAATVGLGLGSAMADGLPGMRGHDHTGITVPDMKQAVDFFVDVLGCKKAMSFGPFSDSKGTFMKDALDVNPRAIITQITMVRCGFGSNIELFSYQFARSEGRPAEEQRRRRISHRLLCRRHQGGGQVSAFERRLDPVRADSDHPGPAAGQAIVYFKAPWGLQLEAISYPNGMAYEKDASTILWSPKDPAK